MRELEVPLLRRWAMWAAVCWTRRRVRSTTRVPTPTTGNGSATATALGR
ncbi:hypothetical protein [Iamia sp.]